MRFHRRFAHFVVASPVGIDVYNCSGGAGLGTLRIAAAQVAFDHFASIDIVIDSAEWASNGAYLASHAQGIVNFFGTGCRIDVDCFNRTSVQAPSLFALGAGIGNRS